MKEDVNKFLGRDNIKIFSVIIKLIKESDLTVESIAKLIFRLDKEFRNGLYIYSLQIKDEELANKIDKANLLLVEIKINYFKQLVDNGNEKRLLDTMNWADKSNFLVEMKSNLYESICSQKCIDIVASSLNNDIDNEVKNSVEKIRIRDIDC